MLQSLHVKNIALIDDVEIDFSKGLNILTGETGAGKSILIDSVNFALGARMPKDIVRKDSDYALCELVFDVEDERIVSALKDMDISLEDGQVILQRKVSATKSICKVNGESVPLSLLKEVATYLIDVHGQHEHQSLLLKKNHKLLLDEFCGAEFKEESCKLREAYKEYKALEKEYEEALVSDGSRQADIDYISFVIDEISNANLVEGEDDKLEADYKRMNNAKRIAETVSMVMHDMSSDEDGAGSRISYALTSLKQAASIDEEANGLYEQLLEIEGLVSDFNRSVKDYEESLEFSQEEFFACEERLNEINRLKSKYGNSIEAILKKLDEEQEKLDRLNDFDAYIKNLGLKKKDSYDILVNACEKISEIRKKEALVLSKDIVDALGSLNFLDARFEIVVNDNVNNITSDGYDDVEFMISTNPGEPIKPLTLVASGGELSRIMLALKSVLAKRDSIETLIFDEIDTGISGMTAQKVADRMAYIGESHQVICITHLPQIASHATTHFLIEKEVSDGHTKTMVRSLNYDESVEELSRMLAGGEITETVRNNAREMKETSLTNIRE